MNIVKITIRKLLTDNRRIKDRKIRFVNWNIYPNTPKSLEFDIKTPSSAYECNDCFMAIPEVYTGACKSHISN